MSTTRNGKKSILIRTLIVILVTTAISGLMISIPTAYAAEEFECIVGVSGTYSTFHESKKLILLCDMRRAAS